MKPILFNTEMSLASREEWKTATRRLVKPQPEFREGETGTPVRCDDGHWCFKIDQYRNTYDFDLKPRYEPGDILYVRETWRVQSAHRFEADANIEFRSAGPMSKIQFAGRCSDSHERRSYDQFINKWGTGSNWHPSIFMPKEAARTFLRVTDVRVERLQDITDEQCMTEGIQQWSKDGKLYKYAPADQEGDYPVWPWQETPRTPREAMAKLWDSTIKKEDLPTYGWAANPYVWVIEFEKISKEEAMKC